jgi:hypothetical protein
MKTQTDLLTILSKNEISQLTKEIKETVATNYAEHKTFSAADLWNIQRARRTTRIGRRFIA